MSTPAHPVPNPTIQKLSQVLRAKENTPPLFKGLSEDNLQKLLECSHVENHPAGKTLIQQGDAPNHLYFILEGSVKTLRSSQEGDEASIRLLRKGDTFMEAVIFMGCSSPISVQTIEEAKLLLIPAQTVKQQVMMDNQFSLNLLEIVTKHYKNAIQQIDSIITKNPVQRVGYYLLKLHLETGREKLGVNFPHQKSIIANHLGMKPETFSRALQKIKEMGVNIDGENIHLQDSFALCHFCDPDTAFMCDRFNTPGCPMA